jgi:membrane-associated phospholipid phosphatase
MTLQNHADDAASALLDVDHKVHEAVKPARSNPIVALMSKLSDISDQPQARTLCGGVIVLGLVRRDIRMIAAGTRMLLAHELATQAKTMVKDRVDRTRPRSADGKDDEKPQAGSDTGKEESSFPSGHSAGAMAVATGFSALYPRQRPLALAAAGAVALAQVPRCSHYLTDVGAGVAIGAAANTVVGLAGRLLMRGVSIVLRR